MTGEKYKQKQRNFIKRECKMIIKGHIEVSWMVAIILALLVSLTAGFEHPDEWRNVTVTLEHYETYTGRGGTCLDIYDTDGKCYTINRNEEAIKEQLVIGQSYTFTYSDNFFMT